MIHGICSRCMEDFYNCRCEYFHPNLTDPIDFILSKDAVLELMKFFMGVGYIDYEAHNEVHRVIKRMHKFIKD